ncbi:Hypp4446 [Branchiostoma lanceolatum]|uniref:Hypp4446 protein n=1 Tax=Branchiostoma lanceolatum TaxID=7740 RepID=A0A8K0A7M9_BRALA|nr:Hypp4446 [Branchiostoma lanceolatum]
MTNGREKTVVRSGKFLTMETEWGELPVNSGCYGVRQFQLQPEWALLSSSKLHPINSYGRGQPRTTSNGWAVTLGLAAH